MDLHHKAIRTALKKFPKEKTAAVLADCGLTREEQASLIEHNAGADLQWIATSLHASDRSVDRLRFSALEKLRHELNS